MAAKRESFLAKLQTELPKQPQTVETPQTRSATPLTRPDIIKSTVYVPTAVHERLREIAFTERVKMHDLLMEGLDRVLESRGHTERTTDRKPL